MSDWGDDSRDDGLGDRERIDAWLSAAMDDALDPEERALLQARIAADEETAARARAFHEVDAALRSMADESISADRLEQGARALRARIDADGEDGQDRGRRSGGGRIAGLAMAVAAAMALYLAMPASEPMPDADPSEELAWVLGYVEDLEVQDDSASLRAVTNEDLDVIEQLDLLDYLAARETKGRG